MSDRFAWVTTPFLASQVLRWAAVGLLFAAGAVALTWPLAAGLGDGIPLGTEKVATVPLFNLWTLAWNVESFSRGLEGYWQAPIFHPVDDTFAFSEPQPVLGLLAFLLVRVGFSTLGAYGLLLIGSLAVNGFLSTVLLRRVGLGWLAALVGGALVLVLPFSYQELGVLQLVPLAGVLTFGLAVQRFAETPDWISGLALGGSLALAYGLSAQVGVFCASAATPAALWLWWPHRGDRRAWMGLVAGVGFFFGLISPLLLVQVRATSKEDFVRSAETVRKHSARPGHYFKSAWPEVLPTPGIEAAKRPSARAFWPGTTRVLLAALALGLALRPPRWLSASWRRFAVASALTLVTSVLLSFGGHLGLGGVSLPDLMRPLPGLGQIRSFFRFALFGQLAVAALAAGALHVLLEQVKSRLEGATRGGRAAGSALVVALAVLAVLEIRPSPGPIEPLPPLDLELPWLAWIEEKTGAQDVLAFLPFPEGRSSGDYLGTSQWMYWQQSHWRRMVNGYSGFFPRHFKTLKKKMEDFPAQDSLAALRDAGVRYCVVPRMVIESSPAPDPEGAIRLELVFRDEEHELAIFELKE